MMIPAKAAALTLTLTLGLAGWLLAAPPASAAPGPEAPAPRFGPAVQAVLKFDAPRLVVTHVRVLDGTGAPAAEDRNVTVEGGRITAIGGGADVAAAAGTVLVDGRGRTLLPGSTSRARTWTPPATRIRRWWCRR
jgi:hypothetical protein